MDEVALRAATLTTYWYIGVLDSAISILEKPFIRLHLLEKSGEALSWKS